MQSYITYVAIFRIRHTACVLLQQLNPTMRVSLVSTERFEATDGTDGLYIWSRIQPTKGGPQVWSLGSGLTASHHKRPAS